MLTNKPCHPLGLPKRTPCVNHHVNLTPVPSRSLFGISILESRDERRAGVVGDTRIQQRPMGKDIHDPERGLVCRGEESYCNAKQCRVITAVRQDVGTTSVLSSAIRQDCCGRSLLLLPELIDGGSIHTTTHGGNV